MIIDEHGVTFSTGKTRYAHGEILGIGPDLRVTYGWDGEFYEPGISSMSLTPAERVELADFMIGLWQQFKDHQPPLAMMLRTDPGVPAGEAHICDADGKLLGKITNLG